MKCPSHEEDRCALHLMKQAKSVMEDQYQMALLWKLGAPQMDGTYQQAVKRSAHLKNC